MDTAKWLQGGGTMNPADETDSTPSGCSRQSLERKLRPQKDQALNCPRCNSTNTKFCYYNNYSLTQPRYFCKACRRYWTEGGSLRNVPIGGGSRKNKRAYSLASSSALFPTSSSAASSVPIKLEDTHELSLKFGTTTHYPDLSQFVPLPKLDTSSASVSAPMDASSSRLTSLDLLTGGGMTSFPPPAEPSTMTYPSGYTFQDFRPTLFPFWDMSRQVSVETSKDQRTSAGGGWWNDMFGGGGAW